MLITSGGKPEVFHCVISGCGLDTRPGHHLSVFLTLSRVKLEISNLVPSNSANVEGVFVGPISPVKTSKKNVQVKYFEGSYSNNQDTRQTRSLPSISSSGVSFHF